MVKKGTESKGNEKEGWDSDTRSNKNVANSVSE